MSPKYVFVIEINRPTRGPTRGIQAQQLIDKKGKLPVPIPQLFSASVGKHAAQLASRIGVEVRTHVIDLGVHMWKAVDESVKAPILQRIMDKFDLQGDPIDVEKAVATQCGRRLSNHNFVLHKKYNKLKETRGEESARNNPPAGVNPKQWTSLVTKKWTVPKWLERSEKNTSNRFDFLPFSNAAFAAAFLPSFLPLCILLLILGALCSAS
ncbi:hypothetical protein RHSIM_Rhsim02G0156600 [Rhododendron simsii]|uniref:Uncharacterized protein n=1 Tax=Rhododendron simsii TaxID=118357 RepID=A0A834HBN4_RHOSS|nr:hypothetical protein RHSIM_Rhsim02G0156600 [Rhododendron simsii]